MGFVSPIYEYNNPSPTIVELLTYWIASSTQDTYTLPKVCSFAERWATIVYRQNSLLWFRKTLEPVIYGTVEIRKPNNVFGCNVKSDVAWGQKNEGQSIFFVLYDSSHVV